MYIITIYIYILNMYNIKCITLIIELQMNEENFVYLLNACYILWKQSSFISASCLWLF